MPVKIRCSSCEKVLNAPDSARGKVVKCPGCEAKIRVPGEEGDAAPARAKAGVKSTVKKAVKKEKSAEDFLSDLDLGNIEDTNSRVCPKCGHESDMEAIECAKCGIEFATGQLSAKAARRKGMRGPDPAEFYSVAWKDSWEFLMNNKKLAVRTGIYWTIFSLVSINLFIFAALCKTWPPRVFWGLLAILFALGPTGWYWYLNGRIIEHTMARAKKLKDIKFDFLLNAALGLKSGAWIFALTFPLVLGPVGVTVYYARVKSQARAAAYKVATTHMDQKKLKEIDQEVLKDALAEADRLVDPLRSFTATVVLLWMSLTGFSALIGAFVFPVAQVHLTMRHSWTAWALWPMLAASFRCFGAVAYFWIMALAAYFIYAAVAIGLSFAWQQVAMTVEIQLIAGWLWVLGICGESREALGFVGYLITEVYILVVLFVMSAPTNILAAFPTVFMMRANGLFGYYNRERLGIMQIARKGEPAGFWPRMIAAMADIVIIAAAIVLWNLILGTIGAIIEQFGFEAVIPYGEVKVDALKVINFLGSVIFLIFYFSRTEGTVDQATPGMRGVGLIVTCEDGSKVTPGRAIGRFFARFLSVLAGGIGFMMAGFTPKRQTLHDMVTKTLVVWQGDDEASER